MGVVAARAHRLASVAIWTTARARCTVTDLMTAALRPSSTAVNALRPPCFPPSKTHGRPAPTGCTAVPFHRYSIVQTEAILLTLDMLFPSQIISKWVDCTIERTGRGVRSAQQ